MIITVIFICAMIVFACWMLDFNAFSAIHNAIHKNDVTDINRIKRRFKKLLKSTKRRDINTVREDLLQTLDDYKLAKTKEFVSVKVRIEKSLREISASLSDIIAKKYSIEKAITAKRTEYKNTGSESVLSEGALLTRTYEMYNNTETSLRQSQTLIQEKLDKLNQEIDLFSSKYELKKAEIGLMLANSLVDVDCSQINLELDDLVVEYKDKEEEIKITQDVTKRVNNIKTDEESVDMGVYKEKFLNY